MVLGDANIHLSRIFVSHLQECTCCHCKQSFTDASIERLLEQAGMNCLNPQVATHVSGSVIDIALADAARGFAVWVGSDAVGESDHWPVFVTTSLQLAVDYSMLIGRVGWKSDEAWASALRDLEECIDAVADATLDMCRNVALAPKWKGGVCSKKQRRALLDVAAWSRDVLFMTAGHLAGLVRVAPPVGQRGGTRTSALSSNHPDDFESFQHYKAAVEQATWRGKSRLASTYADLLNSQPNKAARLLSSFFRPKASQIALVDEESLAPLTPVEMVERFVDELATRVRTGAEQDQGCADALASAVSAIRQSGAHPGLHVWGAVEQHVDPDEWYTMEEVVDALGVVGGSGVIPH